MSVVLAGFGVCLALASAPDQPRYFPVQAFTLAWTHSIEKTRWEEDYTIRVPAEGNQPPKLVAGTARVRGSAAGMEPPPDAVLRAGWYEYQPAQLPEQLRLTRSGYTADYEWCVQGTCRPMTDIMPIDDGGVTLLYACRRP